MKLTLSFLIFICVSLVTFGQNVAIISSFQGSGTLDRNGKTQAISLALQLQAGDVLTLQNGTATILYYSGKEDIVAAHKKFIVPSEKAQANGSFYAMSEINKDESLLSQSGNLYNMRGVKHIFPTNTKIAESDSVQLYVNFEDTSGLNLVITIKDKYQKILYTQAINNSIVTIPGTVFTKQATYSWTVTGTPRNMPELGTIVVTEDQQTKPELTTKLDYLNYITDLYNKGFYYRAIQICVEAQEKFPDDGIFDIIYENLLR